MDELLTRRSTVLDVHADRVEDQLGAQVIGHRPPDDSAGVSIDYDREVEEPFPGAQVGDVRDPQPVRCGGGELPPHQVRCGRGRCGLTAGLTAPAPVGALDLSQPHQPGNRLAVPAVAAFVQLGGEPPGAVDAAVFRPGLPGDLDTVLVVAFPVGGAMPAGA